MSFVEFLQDDPLLTREQVMGVLIQVAHELAMPDERGAAVIAGMIVSQESGVVDNDAPFDRRFWCPANEADAESVNYPHDSMSDDGRSVGYFQQQKGPNGEPWWGGTDSEMDLHSAATQFMSRLKDAGYNASSAVSAASGGCAIQNPADHPGYIVSAAGWWDDINSLYDSVIGSVNVSVSDTPPPVVTPPPNRPPFTETSLLGDAISNNSQDRNGQVPRLFVLHTEEGGMGGAALAAWMADNEVSYHYAVDSDGSAFDLVDTDLASWSVLDANDYTINLVFAGSYSNWTRNQWLQNMQTGIQTAAYIAVQDCLKYGIPIQILVGNNYAKLPTTNGITDHNGITVGLHIGNHTDVGPYFPWDVFNTYLQKFAAGAPLTPVQEDDMFSDDDRAQLQRVYFELTNPWQSRSIYREPNEGPVDTLAGMVLNDDGMEHAGLVERLAVLGDSDSLRRVIRAAAGKGAVADDATVVRAKAVLAQVPQAILQAYDEANGVS